MTSYTVACLVPVLARPHRIAPLIESVRAAAKVTPCRVVFIATEGDDDEIAAITAVTDSLPSRDVTMLVVPPERDSWAMKINHGFTETTEPFVFAAADDVVFTPGCFERMLAKHLETGACVVGTNDGGHAGTRTGEHSTHILFCREYGECGTIDEPDSGKILHDGYAHWFPDTEGVATAKARGTYAHAVDAMVIHEHPNWGKALTDSTYEKGKSSIERDRALFRSREHLWRSL